MSALQQNSFLLLFFCQRCVLAQNNGLTHLPETYRTPLSDMLYDNLKEWRTEADDENPWREQDEETLIKPGIKIDLFPQYNYDSLLQNENETERPVSNILEYTF